ncbi:MAG: accessory gene regulator B family protein [Clostridia bacterium]|jgi:accessory gene regulator B|nr:accessory gene regulator B family protein [Clostridia bacterium]
MDIINNISKKVADFAIENSTKNMTKDDQEILLYRITNFFMNIYKVTTILIIGYILNIFMLMLLTLLSYTLLKPFIRGFHVDSGLYCLIISIFFMVGGAYIANTFTDIKYIYLNIVSFILILIYAPADTKKRPIIDPKYKRSLKIKGIISFILLNIIALNMDILTSNVIYISIFTATLSITPLMYKVFNQPYDNYIEYQKNKA